MTDDLAPWLEARLAEAPPALAAAMRDALPEGPCTLEALDAAAEALMRTAQASAATRDGAHPRLAADGLTTLAQEYRAGSRLPASGSRD